MIGKSLVSRTCFMLSKTASHVVYPCYYSSKPPICIVGSGPSAFYTAQSLLRRHGSVLIDMYEKMPAPYGLIRYGVAPDHQDVKNVINTFTEVAKCHRFQFFGNVNVGTDIKLRELKQAYAAVILAYGASSDRKMGIPGENLTGVISAKDLVGWYNGSPEHAELKPPLDCKTAVVVGMGNVSIDVARILLSTHARLKSTDIPEPVISALRSNRIRRVILLGRRGPLQAAFSLKELRELSRLEVDHNGSSPLVIRVLPDGVVRRSLESDLPVDQLLSALPRPRRRLTEFLLQLEQQQGTDATAKHCDLLFLRSPVRICPGSDCQSTSRQSDVEKIELSVNRLSGVPGENQQIVNATGEPNEFLECGLVVRSIGYHGVPIDSELPFDHDRGVIRTRDSHGRVCDFEVESDPHTACPVYCTGWIRRGAVGVIVDTAVESRDTAQTVLCDLAASELKEDPKVVNKPGHQTVTAILRDRGIRVVSFADWERVDAVEKSVGKSLGKPREKLTSIQSMLRTAFADISQHKRSA